ncbi:uncharacterized protein TNCV_3033331 [Trichonephila clavipes]|nr:uncharacterized protein TNCV_3033331 [Trichonephila clavipes]
MRPLEDVDKNRWEVTDFSVMMVAVDLGTQQIRMTDRLSDQLLQSLFHRHNHADLGHTVLSDEYHIQLCFGYHQKRGWRRPWKVPILLSLLHASQALNQKLWSGVPFRLIAGPLWSSLKAHLQHIENAGPHTTRVAVNGLTACQTLSCPARSPDLSKIEHVWDMMGRRLLLPGNVDDLA